MGKNLPGQSHLGPPPSPPRGRRSCVLHRRAGGWPRAGRRALSLAGGFCASPAGGSCHHRCRQLLCPEEKGISTGSLMAAGRASGLWNTNSDFYLPPLKHIFLPQMEQKLKSKEISFKYVFQRHLFFQCVPLDCSWSGMTCREEVESRRKTWAVKNKPSPFW